MGFVYIWFDRKHQRFYIGCHWGAEDDAYICSSRWMRKAYRRRPEDFKRRVIARVTSSRSDLLTEEHRWLSMIKDHELKVRYYNATKHHNGHWTAGDTRQAVIEKLRGQTRSAETRLRMSESKRNMSDETRRRISAAGKGRSPSAETRQKISASLIGRPSGMTGKKQSDKTRQKISEARQQRRSGMLGKNHSPEARRRISESMKKTLAERKKL